MGCSKERRGNPKREEVLRDKAGWAGLPWLPHILFHNQEAGWLQNSVTSDRCREMSLLPPTSDQQQLLFAEVLGALVGWKVDHQPDLTTLHGTKCVAWMDFGARTPVPGHNAL